MSHLFPGEPIMLPDYPMRLVARMSPTDKSVASSLPSFVGSSGRLNPSVLRDMDALSSWVPRRSPSESLVSSIESSTAEIAAP